ncbi:hypothetical protein FA95DRAFT_1557819 [Auriscalpium vulgare]|uniref:Uncharacterized protein n=1 Tax=Auriscalpium vulgare TaxID=40419 RepID=A0ACB8RX06_9AGAM|nr:hypothetical protein FA95DRAFT_1557819 [Auriscalpium vulgare]
MTYPTPPLSLPSKGDAGRRVSFPIRGAPSDQTTHIPRSRLWSKLRAAVTTPALKSNPFTPGGRRLPTGLADSARARFVSLPVTVPEMDSERDRVARCGGGLLFIPQHQAEAACESGPRSPLQEIAHRPHFARTTSPPPRVPKWPCHLLLSRIKRQLKSVDNDDEEPIDRVQIEALDRQDWADRNHRDEAREEVEDVRAGWQRDFFEETGHVFATPLNHVARYASTTVIMNGYAHDLPIALVAPIEQLFRTGIQEGSLFRMPATSPTERCVDLIDIFNTPPLYGHGFSLRSETTADIAALLTTWLDNAFGGVVPRLICEPLFNYCVKPRRRQRKTELDQEALRISIARDILRLLPSHSLSILVYVFAFFTQLPPGPDKFDLDDVGTRFGARLFCDIPFRACQTTVWLLERWYQILDGLLDPEPMDEYELVSPQREEPQSTETIRAAENVEAMDALW